MLLIRILCTILLLLSLNGCEDFIEKNISKKTVNILTPGDGYNSSDLTIDFWWDKLEGAEQYKLQIVQPSFLSIQKFILDTILSDNHFAVSLISGQYEWRIKAINNGSETEYSYRTFSIDSIISLSSQTVILTSPLNGLESKNTTVVFKWDAVISASNYRFRLIDSTSLNIIVDTLLTGNSISRILSESVYKWMVRAENATSSTLYSERILRIDLTPPSVSSLQSPIHGDTATNPVTLNWNPSISSVGDSLYIYSDTLLTTLIFHEYFTAITYEFTGTINQKYYWRLKSVDQAGNVSSFSSTESFYIRQ